MPWDTDDNETMLADANGLENEVVVPRALLELCLGIIEEVHKTFQTGTNFNDDVLLAIGQLRKHLE